MIDDAEARYVDDLESEWVVSGDPYDVYAQPLCDESGAWDWTHGLNTWGNACKNACRCCGPTCWTGRVDAVMLWRSAPYSRELVITGPGPAGAPILNANQFGGLSGMDLAKVVTTPKNYLWDQGTWRGYKKNLSFKVAVHF